MIVIGHCTACGEFTRIDHHTGLCEWCAEEVEHTADPLWEDDSHFYDGHPARRAEHAP